MILVVVEICHSLSHVMSLYHGTSNNVEKISPFFLLHVQVNSSLTIVVLNNHNLNACMMYHGGIFLYFIVCAILQGHVFGLFFI